MTTLIENVVGVTDTGNGLDVNVQDQTTPPFDLFFLRPTGPPTTLLADLATNAITVQVQDPTFFTAGTYVGILDPEHNLWYFGEQNGAVSGNTFFVNTPIDHSFKAGLSVHSFSRDLNQTATIFTPLIYEMRLGGGDASLDITRLMFSIIAVTAVDLLKFGDLASLNNGLVIRKKEWDGAEFTYRNIFNVRNNGELANLCFDYDPHAKTNPVQGIDGCNFRLTYAGQDKHGVAIRLHPKDSLECIIQDDLAGLTTFRVLAEGHIVDP